MTQRDLVKGGAREREREGGRYVDLWYVRNDSTCPFFIPTGKCLNERWKIETQLQLRKEGGDRGGVISSVRHCDDAAPVRTGPKSCKKITFLGEYHPIQLMMAIEAFGSYPQISIAEGNMSLTLSASPSKQAFGHGKVAFKLHLSFH